jgi:lysine-N-methylase
MFEPPDLVPYGKCRAEALREAKARPPWGRRAMLDGHGLRMEIEAEGPRVSRQTEAFARFRCIGADCEDTCCAGWGIPVDRETYDKYLGLAEQRIGDKLLSNLVEINPTGSSAGEYARFRLEEARCPALQEGLCGIQKSLGEPYLPDLCRKYPRVLNVVGGVVEGSLHLSCPEAARLVLAHPGGVMIHDVPSSATFVADGLYEVRSLLIAWIRERSLPLWQRIVTLGFAVDRIGGVEMAEAPAVLEKVLISFRNGSTVSALPTDSAYQLETVLDLVVRRIGTDYTPARFLDCYKDFMVGLVWTPECTMEELTARYSLSFKRYFLPFLRGHEHLFENYLANYIFRTVFPYRSRLPDQKFALDSGTISMRHSFVILAVHYAILRTILIGMAALHKQHLSINHAVKLVQSYSRAFLHDRSFESAAMEYLEKNAGYPMSKLAQLIMDPVTGR